MIVINKEQLLNELDRFILEERLSEKSRKTIYKYKIDIMKFIRFINHDHAISKLDVLDYKEHLLNNKNYKPRSINSFIVALNKFLYFCKLDDLTIKKIKLQTSSSLDDVINDSDYARMCRHAKKMDLYECYLTIKIISQTGIRIGELKYFTVENLGSFYIVVRNKGKNREIIIPQELARKLRKYAKDNNIISGPLIKATPRQLWGQMKKVAATARVSKKKVHAHSFRHYFAKKFMEQYNNVLDLADILGHNSLETTRIYTRTTSAEKRKRIEAMHKRKRVKTDE